MILSLPPGPKSLNDPEHSKLKDSFLLPRLANKLKQTFVEILFTQFTISLIVICFCVYKITKGDSLDYATITMLYAYAGCMLSELFLYCWYGNALMLTVSFFY